MRSRGISIATALLTSAILATLLALGTVPYANADNVVNNISSITMDAGTTNTELRVKIVSNTAQNPAGDDQVGCNAADGSPASVTLHISPTEGLTASPNPIIFDKCGNPPKTVTLTGLVGGTYEITATVEDAGSNPPSNPGFGVYHTQPFGTVTVVVVDATPPETTIDSGPADPTANQTAVFTFSANEASTFECSLDDITYLLCTSPTTYNNLAEGSNTFYVKATDLSGNTDQTPATYSWEIKAPSITVVASPTAALWGTPISAGGTADAVDVPGLSVTLDWGDGTLETDIPVTSGAWTAAPHTYFTTDPITVTANLTDGVTVRASATTSVTMNKHNTALTLSVPPDVTGLTKYLANGTLIDLDAGGVGISGRSIEFDGDGAPADILTGGPTFVGTMNLVSCDVAPGECSPDPFPVHETSSTDNIVLHLDVGGKIIFPQSTGQAIVFIQDMTSLSFKYKVVEYPNSPQDCDLLTPGLDEECTFSAPSDPAQIPRINAISGYETVSGVKTYNGIKEIIITEISGSTSAGSLGISAIYTTSIDTTPTDQHLFNFENLQAPAALASPFTVSPGTYFAIGVAPELPAVYSLEAAFDGDNLYEPSSAGPDSYLAKAPLNDFEGLGTSFAQSGSGTSVVEHSCAAGNDSDGDGICDTYEDANPKAVTIGGVPGSWPFPATSLNEPAGEDLPNSAIPDIYYEVDCMTGFCPTETELDYIEGRFLLQNIKLHLMLDQTNLPSKNPMAVWSDNDADQTNDFRSIKLNNFGTSAERTQAGGDLGDGKPLFTLKSQVVRYLLIANTIGVANSGPTGIAELNGNDAVVALGSIAFPSGQADEGRIGTIMHEIGHNLGLNHGGTDSDNCKPNYISVMNYNRQLPHTKMPIPGISATTGVGWYGDYSHDTILLRTSANALIVDGKTLNELDLDDSNKLTKSGTWLAFDGVTPISSFKLMWASQNAAGATTVQTANTGALIDWDADLDAAHDSNQVHDLNNLDIIVGTKQFPACADPNLLRTGLKSGGDDYATILANIKKFNGLSNALLGLTPASESDANSIPETNSVIYDELNAEDYEFLGVGNPLNNVAFGEPGIATSKKGNTIHVRFNFNDANGTPITGDNIQSYPIDQIVLRVAPVTSGEPPSNDEYFAPATTTQGENADFFTWDGSKWGFQWGTKTLPLGTYAARIYLVQDDQGTVLDHNGDEISFLVKIVKN